jgi:hypothetical protein
MWIRGPALLHQLYHSGWTGFRDLGAFVGATITDLSKCVTEVLTLVGVLPGIDFIDDNGNRINVTFSVVVGLTSQILWSQPVGSTCDAIVLLSRETKITELGTKSGIYQNIAAFEISMKNGRLGCMKETKTLS